MSLYSTTQAAKRLGIGVKTLSRYIAVGKVPMPGLMQSGKVAHHVWTEAEIEHVRKLLPKIANGRKTRYQKLREKEKAQAGVPVPHKKKRISKKK